VSRGVNVLRAVSRTAVADDLPEVLRLLHTLGTGATPDALALLALSGGQVVVATLLGEVVGVAVLEWLHPVQSRAPQAWLTGLVSAAQHRHHGVARTLLEECARRVRRSGADRLHISSASEADEARGFLCAAGFEARLIVYEKKV
jgi:N-acetylglutamate synthase-like GNAT family acetyltransferase